MKKIILTLFATAFLTLLCNEYGIAAPDQDNHKPVYYQNQVAVLLYHNLDLHENGITITPKRFKEHLDMLQEKGYQVIDLNTLHEYLRGRAAVPPNAVVITFDDGYRSVYQYAYPLLKEKGMPAALFVIVKHLGAHDGNEIPKFSWDEAREMQLAGLSIQSHTYDSHKTIFTNNVGTRGPALTSRGYCVENKHFETVNEYQDRIKNDLSLSHTMLNNQMKKQSIFLAVPFGKENNTIKEIAPKSGFQYIFTTTPGLIDAKTNPVHLNRINAGQAGLSPDTLHNMIIRYAGK